jgi:hypothetical protein
VPLITGNRQIKEAWSRLQIADNPVADKEQKNEGTGFCKEDV